MLKKIYKEFIFDSNTFFKMCHASTIVKLPNGNIACAWFGGEKEGSGDTAIWIAINENCRWSKPMKLYDNIDQPHWNPVLFRKNDGELLLFYKVGHKISEWYTLLRTSKDNGYTWSNPIELVPGDRGGRGPVKNKPIYLSDGSILAPCSTENNGRWIAFTDKSFNNGKTWYKSNDIVLELEKNLGNKEVGDYNIPVSEQSFFGRGIIQPTIWESNPGNIHMFLRSSEGKIYRSDSNDYGITWTKPYATTLPNNNSGIDVIKLKDGTLILAYNPIDINWGQRTPLVLSTSYDNGYTWKDTYILEDGSGEYSYPAIIEENEYIYVSYTWKREKIAICKLKVM